MRIERYPGLNSERYVCIFITVITTVIIQNLKFGVTKWVARLSYKGVRTMRDAKLINVLAEYLAKCTELHFRNEPIPSETLEGFMVNIVSCLDVGDIGDVGKELIPLKKAREIIRLARREFEWQCDNTDHPEDWETCLRNAVSGNV